MGSNSWLYYDKLVRDDAGLENHTDRTSKFDKQNDSGYGDVTGWNTGLKGLHWAFIGDPYSFTALNRRRWEDAGSPTTTSGTEPIWLGTDYGTMTETVNGVSTDNYYNYTQFSTSTENQGLGNADGYGNTTWSLQYCKTGGANDYFIRTATPQKEDGTAATDLTNDYSYLIVKKFTDKTDDEEQSAFVTRPFSLEVKTKEIPKVTIHTAVAHDNDGADNDCFDANVYIYNIAGQLKAQLKRVELKYDEVFAAMPKTLRRYGCSYIQCYLNNYGDAEGGAVPVLVADTQSDPVLQGRFDGTTLALPGVVWKNIDGRKYVEVSYIYDVDQDIMDKFFTDPVEAKQDNYTWTNTYFQWEQVITGGKTTYVDYERHFDHYVYNADGHVIDEVYRYDPIIVTSDGSKSSKPFYGWVSSNTATTTRPPRARRTARSGHSSATPTTSS